MADGIPTPTINWKKDNALLTKIAGKYRAVPGGDLILDNVVVSSPNLTDDLTGLAVVRPCFSSFLPAPGLVFVVFCFLALNIPESLETFHFPLRNKICEELEVINSQERQKEV